MRKAIVYVADRPAGLLRETDRGFVFEYLPEYLSTPSPAPASVSLPLRKEAFESPVLFPFFDGLIPEGWLLDVALDNWKMDPRDRMGLLLTCCRACIGNVGVRQVKDDEPISNVNDVR